MDGTTNINTNNNHPTLDINSDIMAAVRDSAVLADVSISTWSGVKTDKKLLDDLKTRHGAQGDVGRVVKNLLAGADAQLKAAQSAFNACRTHHYQTTLPWTGNANAGRKDGARLLPNMLFDQYVAEMAKLRQAAMAALEELIAAYPTAVERARQNLGSMADELYPTPEQIRGRFNIVLDFEPIPDTAGSFAGLRPEMVERLRSIMAQRQRTMIEGSQQAMWENVREKVSHMVDRLKALASDDAKPEDVKATRFHTSSVEHVRELLTFLPGWNLVGDQRVADVVTDIRTMLDNIDAEKIKNNTNVRDSTLVQAQSVMEKLTSWGV